MCISWSHFWKKLEPNRNSAWQVAPVTNMFPSRTHWEMLIQDWKCLAFKFNGRVLLILSNIKILWLSSCSKATTFTHTDVPSHNRESNMITLKRHDFRNGLTSGEASFCSKQEFNWSSLTTVDTLPAQASTEKVTGRERKSFRVYLFYNNSNLILQSNHHAALGWLSILS